MFRSILFNFIFWPVFCLILIVMYPFTWFLNQEQTFRIPFRFLTTWLNFCLKYFARIDYKIENIEILNDAIKKGPVIIGCNHQSAWETFIFSLLPIKLSIVIKKELLKKPVAGLYFRRLKCIPVDRESPVKAIKTLLKEGKEAHEKGNSILIFPNGTRSSYGEDAEYKSGIFALYRSLNIPVIPAHTNSGKFWSRNSFRKKPGTIILKFSKPISPGLDKEIFFDELTSQ